MSKSRQRSSSSSRSRNGKNKSRPQMLTVSLQSSEEVPNAVRLGSEVEDKVKRHRAITSELTELNNRRVISENNHRAKATALETEQRAIEVRLADLRGEIALATRP